MRRRTRSSLSGRLSSHGWICPPLELLEPRRLLAAGDVDTTFGTAGMATASFGSASTNIACVALQADGKLVAAGEVQGQGYAVARFNTDGSLDTTFGNNGTVIIDSAGSAHQVAIEPDGKIVIVGDRNTGTDDMLVVRLTASGALDSSFGTNGQETLNLGFGGGLDINAAGTVFVAGDLYGTYNAARLNADGSIDASFGNNGIASLPAQPFTNGNVYDLALQSDGKIVVGGSGGIMVSGPGGIPSAVPDFAVVRFNSDGTPDTSFGTGGVVQTTFRGIDDGDAMAIQGDGKILLAGSSSRPSGAGYDMAMARYNSDGTLDSTFGSGGKVLDTIGSQWSTIEGLLAEPGGKIVAVGQANGSGALFRFNANGSLDSSFGSNGIVSDSSGVGSVIEQADGKFVVTAGSFSLERYFGEAPPTASGISDVSVPENSTPTVIALANDFQGGSVPASQLIYSITADSNPALFSSMNIDAKTGNLTLAYVANQTGNAQLTVRATDPDGAYVKVSFHVAVSTAAPQVDSWISSASGFWDVASNWSGGNVPGTGDSVVIDSPGVTVTIRSGDYEVLDNLTTAAGTNLAISGGTLTIEGGSTLTGALEMTGGLLRATGAQTFVNVDGTSSVAGASLDAEGGATLALPTVATYQNLDESAMAFQANGSGSALDLPGLTAFGALDSALSVTAAGGGHVDLSSLGAIQNSAQTPQVVELTDDGSGSQIDLSSLATFDGGDNSALSVTHDATILTPLLSTLSDVDATLDGTDAHVADLWVKFVSGTLQVTGGSYRLPNLVDVDGSSLLAVSGGTLALPNVTTYVTSPANFIADGAGSILDLSALTSILQQAPTLAIYATNGGQVNLDGLTSLVGSIVNDKGNGRLLDRNVTTIAGTVVTLDGTDPDVAASWTKFTGGLLSVTGGAYNLAALTDVDGTNLYVQSGGRLALPAVKQLLPNQTLLSDGAGSLLDLSNLSSVAEPQPQGYLSITAAHGGEIVVTNLTSLKGGDNSIEFSDTGNSQILDPNLASLAGATIWLDGTDPDVAAAWTSVVDGRLIIQGGVYALTGLTDGDFVFLSLSRGASLTLPGALTLASGNSIVLAGGATLSATGGLIDSGNITLGAGSILNVGGDFSESQNAALTVQIGGAPASGQFGRLAVDGTAALAGAFDAALVNGFVPPDNADYKTIAFSSVSGSFATIGGLSPNFSLHVEPESLDLITAVKDTIDSLQSATLAETEGATFDSPLATFTDANPLAVPGNFTATINWGDGSSSAGTITANGGVFTVLGSHTYAEEGQSLPLSVTINDVGGAQATASGTANVSDAPIHLTPASIALPSSGAADNLLVATFSDDGGPEPLAHYAATIDWGDGTTTAGSISLSNGVFQIAGSHQYTGSGTFTIGVSVKDDGGSSDALTEEATLNSRPHQKYVTAVYEDVLGRAPDATGLMWWTLQLDNGAPASSVAEQVVHSAEYYAKFVIEPTYLKLLDRPADVAGVEYWTSQMGAGVTDQGLEAYLVSSQEFYQNAGGTNLAWIDAVYKLLLGRPADAAGESYWTSQLAAGETLSQAAQGIAGSQENNTLLINDDYFHYLGRPADAGGLSYWLAAFAAGQTNEDVIAGFTGSAEYYQEHTASS